MTIKAKNSKKQQQAVATTMVIPNPFVVPDKIFGKISTSAASPLLDMDDNSSSTSSKMGQDQPLAVLPNVILSSRSLSIPVAKQPIILDDLKDWADQIEMESTASFLISGAADGGAWENVNGHQRFSDWVASNLVPGATFKIKLALLSSLFQLLPGCIELNSVSQDAVKLFCMEFASQESLNSATKVAIGLDYLALECKVSSLLPSKVSSNFFGGLKVFKSLFAESKSYAKAAAVVVPPIVAAANMNLDLSGSFPTTILMLFVALSVINIAVKARLAFLESHLGKLSLLIKFLVEPIGVLVVLVTKLLFTPPAVNMLVKKSVTGLAGQNKDLAAIVIVMQKRITCLKKKYEQACLEDVLDNDDMDDNDNDNVEDKDFSWMSSMVKNSHELISIMATKQNQEEEQSNKSDDDKSNNEDQKEPEETAKLTYTIFTSNGKPLNNIKADKKRIMVNDKLICWSYYDIFRRTFDRKPGKKAKYSYWWHGLCAQCWCNKLLYLPMSDNNVNSEVTPVTQRSTSVEIIDSEYQVEGNITSTAKREEINTNPQNLSTVETARLNTPPFKFKTTNRLFGSVNTSSGDNTPFKIANISKKTALHRRAADFSPITANKLKEKINKKYRHIERISIKVLKEDRERAAQIEAALRKCNLNILDRINRENSAIENKKQMDNPFDTNRNKSNVNDTAEDIEDSELSLLSRMVSLSPEQYSSKSLGKKPMLMEANQKKRWRTVVYGTKRHVLFVQALDIPEKIMEKKVG
ncbi:hypothetical protein G9A89_011184 [Geosiphon pyriformis]|nr:hypothetical protein G9A89_011184 [Geosiphon pyriformis]